MREERREGHHNHHISENERENAKPGHEEQLFRVADAAEHVAEKSTHDMKDKVANCLVAKERLRPGKTLDEIEHADHRSKHYAPDSHIEEKEENVVTFHTVKLAVTNETNTNLVH